MDVFGVAGISGFVSEAAGFVDDIASVVQTVVEPKVVTTHVVKTVIAGDPGASPSPVASVDGDTGSVVIPASPNSDTSSFQFGPQQSQLSTRTGSAHTSPRITRERTTPRPTVSLHEPTSLPISTSPPAQITGSTPTTMSTALPSLFDTSGSDKQHGPPKAAVIAGATVGGLAGLAAVLAILILCFRRRRRLMPTRAAHRGSIESAGSSDASFFSPPRRRSIWDTSGPTPYGGKDAPGASASQKEMTIARKPVPATMSSLIPAAHWKNNTSDAPHDPASSSEDMRGPPGFVSELPAQPTPPRRRSSQDFIAPRPAPPTTQPAPVARGHTRDRSQPVLAPPLPIIPTLTSQPVGPPPQRPPRPQEPVDELTGPQPGQNHNKPPVPGTGQNRLNELHFDFDLTPGGQYNRQPGYMNNRGQPPPRFNLNLQNPGPGPRGPRPSRLPVVPQQKQWPPAYPPVPSHDRSSGPPRHPGPASMNPYPQARPAAAPQGSYHHSGPSNAHNKLPPKRQRGPAIRVVTPTDSTFPLHSGSDSVSTITQTYPPVHPSQQARPQQSQPVSSFQQRYHPNPSPLNPHYMPNQRYHPPYGRPNPGFMNGNNNTNNQNLSPGNGPGPSFSPGGYSNNLSPAGYGAPPGRFSAYAPSILSAATSRHVSYDEYGRRRRSDPFDLE